MGFFEISGLSSCLETGQISQITYENLPVANVPVEGVFARKSFAAEFAKAEKDVRSSHEGYRLLTMNVQYGKASSPYGARGPS
jgi:hypothetical protein